MKYLHKPTGMTFDADVHTMQTARDLAAFILKVESVPEHDFRLVSADSVPVTVPLELNP
jgi:hypothetical protein